MKEKMPNTKLRSTLLFYWNEDQLYVSGMLTSVHNNLLKEMYIVDLLWPRQTVQALPSY